MEASTMTLKNAVAAYITHLEETGQKPSTVGTARRTMDLLIADMGEGKVVGKILPVHVSGFFKSETATTRNGKPRAPASVLQIRRIVRAALVWWHEQGWCSTVPLPADEKRFLEGSKGKKATEPAADATAAE